MLALALVSINLHNEFQVLQTILLGPKIKKMGYMSIATHN